MNSLSINFGNQNPAPFREQDCDIEFEAKVRGRAEIYDFDAARYGEGNAAQIALTKKIAELIPECIDRRSKEDLLLSVNAQNKLSDALKEALADAGVTAFVVVKDIKVVPEQKNEEYMRLYREALTESLFPQVKTDGLTDEPHGPLIGFSYNLSSHGMMMGSGSYSGDSLSWNRDGTVTLSVSSNGGGRQLRAEYLVDSETAEKMRAFVADKHLAALAKQEIRTPLVYDDFTSASFSMTFDDSSVGGSPYNHVSVNCGPAGMTFRSIEKKIREILEQCKEHGQLTFNEENATNNGAMGGFGFGDLSKMMMTHGGANGTNGTNGTAGSANGTNGANGAAGSANGTATSSAAAGCWVCSSCGFAGNKGKFCIECGSR